MNISSLVLGLATYVPGVNYLRYKVRGGGSTFSARYCYSVWMRHLVLAYDNGLKSMPKVVAELGPGESIGVGLAALLCGSDHYYALDVVDYSNTNKNISVFDELVILFHERAEIPGKDEFPEINPVLDDYSFPERILTPDRLAHSLSDKRLEKIRESIIDSGSVSSMINYQVPWNDPAVIDGGRVDMIFSQAVLEHVEELGKVYKAMHDWLSSDGFSSHQIDFKSHGTSEYWNGHWTCSKLLWRLIQGGRPYLINREPCSVHCDLHRGLGVEVVFEQRVMLPSMLTVDQLADDFKGVSDEDLTTSTLFIQSIKR